MWGKNHELKKLLGDKSTSAGYDRSTDSLEALADALTASRYSTGTVVEDGATGTATTVIVATANAAANTFGSWVEIDASLAAASYITSIMLFPAAVSGESIVLEIGTGTAGNEVAILRFSNFYLSATGGQSIKVTPPKYVASATRLAARTSVSGATVRYCIVSVQYWNGL